MRISRAWFLVAAGVCVALLALVLGISPAAAQGMQPGNYCVACHTADDRLLADADRWQGSYAAEAIDPCPALKAQRTETYYTERLLLAAGRARTEAGNGAAVRTADARLTAFREGYGRLLDTPASSLDAFTSQAQLLRYNGNKAYTQILQAIEAGKGTRVLLFAGLVTLILLGSLVWGLRNTLKLRPAAGLKAWWRPGWRTGAILGLVFVLFALPIFRIPSTAVTTATAEEQAAQTVLDTSGRVADTADRALARAWMLARVGAAWAPLDAARGQEALTAALAAADEAQLYADALWGEAQAAQEAAVGSTATQQEKALLLADQLAAVRSRAWGLRLIAAEWAAVDKTTAIQILTRAQALAESGTGIYRDLDLRAIAAEWAKLDPNRAVTAASAVRDPALRAWAYREVAATTGNAALLQDAAAAARAVADPVRRSQALARIAAAAGDRGLAAEAVQALDAVQGASRAYALSDLAAVTGDAALVNEQETALHVIEPAYPDAVAAAWLAQGQFDAAWSAAAAITDPFDRARGQAEIAAAWGNAAAARQIADPTLRDRALGAIAMAKQDIQLAEGIASPYERDMALAQLGQFQAVAADADTLSELYPLRVAAVAQASQDSQASLDLVDKLDQEADKAAVLAAVVAATGDPAVFDRALGMALAGRVRGDALAPAEASLALARAELAFDRDKAAAAIAQAYDATSKIAVTYK